MTPERLAALIREFGVQLLGETVAEPGRMFKVAMERGWNLTPWRVSQSSGAVRFWRDDDPTCVLVLNAPESARADWEARLLDWALTGEMPDAGATILIMEPQQ